MINLVFSPSNQSEIRVYVWTLGPAGPPRQRGVLLVPQSAQVFLLFCSIISSSLLFIASESTNTWENTEQSAYYRSSSSSSESKEEADHCTFSLWSSILHFRDRQLKSKFGAAIVKTKVWKQRSKKRIRINLGFREDHVSSMQRTSKEWSFKERFWKNRTDTDTRIKKKNNQTRFYKLVQN